MPLLPPEGAPVSPLLTAALLLVAVPLLQALGLPHPTVAAVIAATGVSRSRAYELRAAVEALLPTVLRPPGRPPKAEPAVVGVNPLLRAVRDFLMDHPGAVEGTGARRRYADAFRRRVLELASEHDDVPVESIADAVGVPVATLRDWLHGGVRETAPTGSLASVPPPDPTVPQVETLLALWSTWHGSFSAFCRHCNEDWRLPFRKTLIADILEQHGVRWRKRRSGRSPDEDALRGQFLTWFPNAQWVEDGALVTATIDGQTFAFNLELVVDPCSGAFTGVAVTDTEDAAAVIDAVRDGEATTGATPLSVLLDNKPSNHAEEVKAALAPVELERATPHRPQNKAHVEGGFGLFRQVAPALALLTGDPRAIARTLVELVAVTWARTRNHRPRKDRGGRSRVELHLDHEPTAEEIEAARNALRERLRKQEKARATRAARQDPQVRAALADAFARFGFADPDGALLGAIARYPLEAVVEGIAIVDGKRRAGTFPASADARYLLGVVRNVAEEREGWEIALALFEERRRAHDRALEAAERARDAIEEEVDDVPGRLAAYVDRALRTSRRLDRFFWLRAAADVVRDEDEAEHEPLFRLAARRIHATHAVTYRERLAATRFFAAQVLPLA